jgi:DNA-binding GntR family transcriptional regulator
LQLPPITPLAGAAPRPFARSIHGAAAAANYAAFRLFAGDEPPTLSVKDQVAVAVAERIVERRLAPGQRVPEQQIADEFKVSKAPVSEALLQLEHVGLVESSTRRSAFVTRMSEEDFQELVELRAPLARVYLAHFFDRHGAADRKYFRDTVSAMESMLDDEALAFPFIERGDRASLYMAHQAGNRRIARTMSAYSLQFLRYLSLGLHPAAQRRQQLAGIRDLLRFMEAGDRAGFLARCERIMQFRVGETVAALRAIGAGTG